MSYTQNLMAPGSQCSIAHNSSPMSLLNCLVRRLANCKWDFLRTPNYAEGYWQLIPQTLLIPFNFMRGFSFADLLSLRLDIKKWKGVVVGEAKI